MTRISSIELASERDSEYLARRLASALRAPLILTFSGEIGAGKTTLIRGMLRNLGIQSAIKSPTFSLVESYEREGLQIHHFDLYRIHDESELEYIGFREYFHQNAICCIEWPERAKGSLEQIDMNFGLTFHGGGRLLTLSATGTAGNRILSYLVGPDD